MHALHSRNTQIVLSVHACRVSRTVMADRMITSRPCPRPKTYWRMLHAQDHHAREVHCCYRFPPPSAKRAARTKASAIRRIHRLHDLPDDLAALVEWGTRRGSLSMSTASELLRLSSSELIREAIVSAIEYDLTKDKSRQVVQIHERTGEPIAECVQRALLSLLYTGEMSGEERETVHKRFLHDPGTRVMCASLKAAGVGLTWTVAAFVYHLDLWWNPQVLRQGDRLPLHHGRKMVCRIVNEQEHRAGVEPALPRYECGVLASGRPVYFFQWDQRDLNPHLAD
jgi:hypothetical protein